MHHRLHEGSTSINAVLNLLDGVAGRVAREQDALPSKHRIVQEHDLRAKALDELMQASRRQVIDREYLRQAHLAVVWSVRSAAGLTVRRSDCLRHVRRVGLVLPQLNDRVQQLRVDLTTLLKHLSKDCIRGIGRIEASRLVRQHDADVFADLPLHEVQLRHNRLDLESVTHVVHLFTDLLDHSLLGPLLLR